MVNITGKKTNVSTDIDIGLASTYGLELQLS